MSFGGNPEGLCKALLVHRSRVVEITEFFHIGTTGFDCADALFGSALTPIDASSDSYQGNHDHD